MLYIFAILAILVILAIISFIILLRPSVSLPSVVVADAAAAPSAVDAAAPDNGWNVPPSPDGRASPRSWMGIGGTTAFTRVRDLHVLGDLHVYVYIYIYIIKKYKKIEYTEYIKDELWKFDIYTIICFRFLIFVYKLMDVWKCIFGLLVCFVL